MKTPEPGNRVPCQGSLSVWTETQEVDSSWVTWPGSPLLLQQTRGGPSPTSAAGGGGRAEPAGPHSRAGERLIFSTWPLFPAWRELGGQSREEGGQGGQGDLEAGPQGMSDCAPLPSPREPGHRAGSSAAVQRGYEEDAVLILQLVVQLALAQEREEETIRGFSSAGGGGLATLGEEERIYQKNGGPAY